ncbi:MAG: ABC transporter substrate-binding protein [Acidimicrobiales bacterium]
MTASSATGGKTVDAKDDRRRRLLTAGLALCTVAACSNATTKAPSTSAPVTTSPVAGSGGTAPGPTVPGDSDGITPTQVQVGALVTASGPLGGAYGDLVKGVKAYFDVVNGKGGINGRQLVLTQNLDDGTNPTRNTSQARALVEDDHVFAVFASSPLFPAGTYLAQKGVPTFGTNFNVEWSSGPSMFGHNGSFNDVHHPGPFLSWLAQKNGATAAALVAYTVAESADCATGQAEAFKRFGVSVPVLDNSLPFGASDATADIQKMKDNHVGFVATCMDPTGNVLIARGLQKAGLTDVHMYWPNGYSSETLKNYAASMEGVYFGLSEVPLEDRAKSPEMQLFFTQMAKVNPGAEVGEEALYGWVVADLFARGLTMAGPNPTRSSVVAKLNTITHWTGEGLIATVDWTKQHSGTGPSDCTAVVQVQKGKFVPVFDTPDSPFVCFAPNSTTTRTVPGQPYTDRG